MATWDGISELIQRSHRLRSTDDRAHDSGLQVPAVASSAVAGPATRCMNTWVSPHVALECVRACERFRGSSCLRLARRSSRYLIAPVTPPARWQDVTLTPATGLPNASRNRMAGAVGKSVFHDGELPSPAMTSSWATAPTSAVTPNVAGLR